MVERFFRDLTENRLRRGASRSVEELIAGIDEFFDRHNKTQSRSSGPPKPPTSSKRSSVDARHAIIGNLHDALP